MMMLGHPMEAELRGLVTEFMTAMGQEPDAALQWALVNEEAEEVLQAARVVEENPTVENMAAYIKETVDLLYVSLVLINVAEGVGEEAVRVAGKAFPDLPVKLVVITQLSDIAAQFFMGDEVIVRAFHQVHESNMSKLDDGGNPIRRDDGKIMKGPNYVEADLRDLAEEVLRDFLAWKKVA